MAGRRYLNLLREDVKNRNVGQAGILPTHRELALRYHCSVSSIRQAISVLRDEGLLNHENFIPKSGKPAETTFERRRIIGAVVLRQHHYELIEQLKVEWQRLGWFITAYDAWSDFQDPQLERNFLEQACREKFAGVVIAATPVAPLNTEIYERMRQQGMKVAHLSNYRDDLMHDESFFIADYRAAGRLGVAAALQRGCRAVAMLSNQVSSPFMQEMHDGVYELTGGLGMPEPVSICCNGWGAFFQSNDQATMELKLRLLQEHLPELAALPERCAILCCGAEMAFYCRRLLTETGVLGRKQFLILSLNNGSLYGEEEDGVIFDFEAQLRSALNYVCDESIDAQTVVQNYFKPTIRVAKDCRSGS